MARKKGKQIRLTVPTQTYERIEEKRTKENYQDIPEYIRDLIRKDLKE